MYPERRSASTSVPYSQKRKIGAAVRFVSFPGSITADDVARQVKGKEENRQH